MSRWNSECNGGANMPFLSVGGCTAEDIRIDVIYHSGVSTNTARSCGNMELRSGVMTGGTMHLYEFEVFNGQNKPCASHSVDTITHELGHALGLADVEDESCRGHIMGKHPSSGDRTIYDDDCAQANANWNTAAELQAECDRRCWTICDQGVCPPQPVTSTPHPTITPILLDLDQNGFHLAGLEEAVMFDLDADGRADRISWTAAYSGDAFLVLDRNGNGRIDDGRELFGNATRLASGTTAANGYEALSEFDDAAYGGNGDFMLDASDAAWELLQIWTDRNRDGISDADELASLSAAGIVDLDTRYKRSNKSDVHGNIFRFRSKATVLNPAGQARPSVTYDVYFVESPQY
ncbi:MAG TPA: hypothetical protein VEK79_14250 [Thermoanaerobaculia bacterium]|nr:hypothetical protein [Thermoanaerobaculia bacterium]